MSASRKTSQEKNDKPTKWQPDLERSFFVARAPMLPFDCVEQVGSALAGPQAAAAFLAAPSDERTAARERCDRALAADAEAIRTRLRAILQDRPTIREAIFIGSPSLELRLDEWLKNPTSEKGASVEPPLYRYFTRMAARSMAFGFFAGTAFGRFGDTTDLASLDGREFARKTDLDLAIIQDSAVALANDPNIRTAFRYHANETLFLHGPHARFLATVYKPLGKEEVATFEVALIERDEYVDAVLEKVAPGASFEELVQRVMALRVARPEAEDYIQSLIDEQLLVADIYPSPSALDPVGAFVATLATHEPTRALGERLSRVRTRLTQLDAEGLGHPPARYRESLAPLKGLPGIKDPDKAFRANLLKVDGKLSVGPKVVKDLLAAIEFLRGVPGAAGGREEIDRFARAFEKRYEGRAVPLLEALDPDVGLGMGEVVSRIPLLDDLPHEVDPPEASMVRWDRWSETLYRKVVDSARTGQPIVLTEQDLPKTSTKVPMPEVLDVAFRLGRTVAADGTESELVWFEHASGPQTGVIVSRFGFDPRVKEALTQVYAEEARREDAIVAEVVHTVRGKAANALMRAGVRSYEIPCPDAVSVDADHTIPLSDLLVRATGGRVLLFSKRLGRRVKPRLTNAHSYMMAPCTPYRFLALLQGAEEDAVALGFQWGPLSAASMLPRVMYKNIVLARARWRLGHEELKTLTGASSSADRFLAMHRLRARHQLPRYIVGREHDQEMIVDLDNHFSVDSFVDMVAKRSDTIVEEMLPDPQALAAGGKNGRFVSDCRATFLTAHTTDAGDATKDAGRASLGTAVGKSIARSLRPGSDWLYARLYAGTDTCDELIRDGLSRFVAKHAALFDKWFFLSYRDPDNHLRVRFRGDPQRLTKELLPALTTELAGGAWHPRVHRLELGTYEREVERYGGHAGIELSESVFHADSEAAIDILARNHPEEDIWKIALLGVHTLLTGLGFSMHEELEIARAQRDGMRGEFRAADALDIGIGKRFRTDRQVLERLLRGEGDEWADARATFAKRATALAPIAEQLRAAESAGALEGSLSSVARSYVHMTVLRLLPRANRAHEYVLLDFLTRFLGSVIARKAT